MRKKGNRSRRPLLHLRLGNRGLDRPSHNVAQTFRSAYIWCSEQIIRPYIVGRLCFFSVVRQPVETTPAFASLCSLRLCGEISLFPLILQSNLMYCYIAGSFHLFRILHGYYRSSRKYMRRGWWRKCTHSRPLTGHKSFCNVSQHRSRGSSL